MLFRTENNAGRRARAIFKFFFIIFVAVSAASGPALAQVTLAHDNGAETSTSIDSGASSTNEGSSTSTATSTDSGGGSASMSSDTECQPYLADYLKLGAVNNPDEVKKLQVFLNNFEGAKLDVGGTFDQAAFDAVSAFQKKYSPDVLEPWTITKPTGYVYITTKKKINEIYCRKAFPLTADEEATINSAKNMLRELRQGTSTAPQLENEVGVNASTSTLAGTSNNETGKGALAGLASLLTNVRVWMSGLLFLAAFALAWLLGLLYRRRGGSTVPVREAETGGPFSTIFSESSRQIDEEVSFETNQSQNPLPLSETPSAFGETT